MLRTDSERNNTIQVEVVKLNRNLLSMQSGVSSSPDESGKGEGDTDDGGITQPHSPVRPVRSGPGSAVVTGPARRLAYLVWPSLAYA